MKKRNAGMSAVELMAELSKDPGFLRRDAEKEEKHREAERAATLASSGVLAELSEIGYPCRTVDEIVRTYSPLPRSVVDCITAWIPRISDDGVKEMLIRSLGAAKDNISGKVLEDAYRSSSHSIGIQFAVLNTIAMKKPKDISGFIDELLSSNHLKEQLIRLGF